MRLLLFVVCPLALHAMDCAHPENSAEKTVCSHPDLLNQEREIDRLTSVMKTKLTGENAAILSDTDFPFVRQRNNCSNEQGDIQACLGKVLTERLDLLRRAGSQPDSIRKALEQAYFIDIPFLRKYAAALDSRTVSVYGCLSLEAAAPRTHAELETENQPAVPLTFKSMPENIAEFLDDQRPCAHWLVTVHNGAGKLSLYADEVAGVPLP